MVNLECEIEELDNSFWFFVMTSALLAPNNILNIQTKKRNKTVSSMIVIDHVWTVPKARGVKIIKKIRPDSIILLYLDIFIGEKANEIEGAC